MARILIAEDDLSTRMLIEEFLKDEGYEVESAEDGLAALEILEKDSNFDMVLSDINMPRMKGHELLHKVEEKFPGILRVLITGYNIEEYISIAKDFGISNIITKTVPFNFDEIATYLKMLLSGDIFGIDKYIKNNTDPLNIQVLNPKNISKYAANVTRHYKLEERNKYLQLVLIEVLNNAIYYGIKNEDGAHKENWEDDFELEPGQVDIICGGDEHRIAISIVDKGGSLSKDHILYWLSRQIEKDESGLPLGLLDVHGRGIFLSREYMDRLIVNIEKGKKTEVICINYTDSKYEGPKPLLINEIG